MHPRARLVKRVKSKSEGRCLDLRPSVSVRRMSKARDKGVDGCRRGEVLPVLWGFACINRLRCSDRLRQESCQKAPDRTPDIGVRRYIRWAEVTHVTLPALLARFLSFVGAPIAVSWQQRPCQTQVAAGAGLVAQQMCSRISLSSMACMSRIPHSLPSLLPCDRSPAGANQSHGHRSQLPIG